MNNNLLRRWQFQDAKARFSRLVTEVETRGRPQIVNRHGRDVVAVIPIADLPKVMAKTPDELCVRGGLLSVFKRAPRVELKIERSRERARPGPDFQ